MGRLIAALIAFAVAIVVIKMVIVALVIAGLIFRPKETIGLLLFGGWITLTTNHPTARIGVLILFVAAAIWMAKNKDPAKPE